MTVETHWWKLNEGTGNPEDSGTSEVDLTNSNATWTTGGKVWNDVLDFNGTTSYLTMNDLSNISSDTKGSFSVWVYMDDDSNDVETIMGVQNSVFSTYLSILYLSNASNTLLSIGAVMDNTTKWIFVVSEPSIIANWNHLVLLHDGATPKLYINGVLQTLTWTDETDKTIWMSGLFTASSVPNQFNVGCVNVGVLYYLWDGKIQDVRYYNKSLTQAEIDFLYNSGSGQTDGMVILYTRNIAEDPLITINSTNTSVVINSSNTTVNIDSTNTIVEVLE